MLQDNTQSTCRFSPGLVFALHVAALLASIALGGNAARADQPAQASVEADQEIRLGNAERPAIVYRHAGDRFKPYIKQWHSRAGVPLVMDRPSDHPHHRGLMLALGVNEAEFWHEHLSHLDSRSPRKATIMGRQVTRPAVSESNPAAAGPLHSIEHEVDWLAGDKRLMVETRRLSVLDIDDPLAARILTWQSRLTPEETAAPVELWGTHYFGLGMRFPLGDAPFKFTSADGKPSEPRRDTERLLRGDWCACFVTHQDKPLTIVAFDAPQNPRPARWFTMYSPFAYFTATMDIESKPLEVHAGKPVKLTYGFLVADRALGPAEIDRLRATWLAGIEKSN